MFTKKLHLPFVVIALITIVLSACAATAPTNVEPVVASQPPATSSWDVSGYNGQICPQPEGMVDIVSPEKDFRVTVRMTDGRLFQPCLPEEAVRPAFQSSFTAYCPSNAAECKMTVHTINSELWLDADKDGMNETLLASHVGSKVITVHNGDWMKIIAGDKNGGLDLTPFVQ